jgi:hypothetical protein
VITRFGGQVSNDDLSKVGHHWPSAAMGVPRDALPKWDGTQFLVGQLHKLPLLDEKEVGTDLVIGRHAAPPGYPASDAIGASCSNQAAGCIIVTICFGIARTEGNAMTPDYLETLPWCVNR